MERVSESFIKDLENEISELKNEANAREDSILKTELELSMSRQKLQNIHATIDRGQNLINDYYSKEAVPLAKKPDQSRREY